MGESGAVPVQKTKDRKAYICAGYLAGGVVTMLLPAASAHSVVAGFITLTAVIVLALCPNGPLLALASVKGSGPALPLNLAVFNSVSNLGGLFAPWLVGLVVQETCSFDWALYIMGGVLMSGGVLAFAVSDEPLSAATVRAMGKRGASYVELASTGSMPHFQFHDVQHHDVQHHDAEAIDET